MRTTHPPMLGELETAVMDLLWQRDHADVKSAHAALGPARRITLNTVQSTMERLFRKGLLAREKVSHAFVYSPRVTRAELHARILEQVVARVVGSEQDVVLSTFVDLADRAGEGMLDRLERLVAERRGRKGRTRS